MATDCAGGRPGSRSGCVPETADVVIVGGGVVGAAAAWALRREAVDVVLLEQGPVNREGSGTTAGNLHIQAIHAERPGQATPVDVGRFLPLQKAASSLWDVVADQLGEDVGLRRTGGLTVAETDAEVDTLVAKAKLEEAEGIPTEIIYREDLDSFAPQLSSSVRAATWCPLDGYANPLQVTMAFLREATRLGARVAAFRPVRGLRRTGGRWTVHIDGGDIVTPVVIDAAGPDVPTVAAMADVSIAAAVAPLQMHISTRVPPMLPALIQHIGQGLSVKQVSTGQILIGGGWPAAAADENGRSPARIDSLVGNLDLACRIVPALADVNLLRVWGGPVLATADEMPVIGELSGSSGLYLCGGTYAFTLAPLWAETLRAMVLGQAPPVPVADLSPDRLVVAQPPPART
jgi:sarcosine oxidase subunit beta